MNLIKVNNKDFIIIDGGFEAKDDEVKITVKNDNYDVETIADDFSAVGETLSIYDCLEEGVSDVAVSVFNGYSHLKSVEKNLDDDTIKILLAKESLVDRIKALEDIIDTLTLNDLTE